MTPDAFIYGAVFVRKSIAEQQKLSFERQADFLEQSIADAITGGQIGGLNAESFGPLSGLIAKLREMEPVGRQVIDADPLRLKTDPKLDFSVGTSLADPDHVVCVSCNALPSAVGTVGTSVFVTGIGMTASLGEETQETQKTKKKKKNE